MLATYPPGRLDLDRAVQTPNRYHHSQAVDNLVGILLKARETNRNNGY